MFERLVMCLAFIFVTLLSNFCFATETIIDLSETRIVSQKILNAQEIKNEETSSITLAKKAVEMIKEASKDKQLRLIIDFSKNEINDESFDELTEGFLSRKYKSEKKNEFAILDLSSNSITEKSTNNLLKWLNFDENIKINLTATPVGLKYIKKIYDALQDLSVENPLVIMSRLIFIPKDYLWQASNTVKIYSTFVKEKVIPENWVTTHKNFYDDSLIKKLLEQRKDKKTYEFLKDLGVKQCIVEQSYEGTSDTSEITFAEALKSLQLTEK